MATNVGAGCPKDKDVNSYRNAFVATFSTYLSYKHPPTIGHAIACETIDHHMVDVMALAHTRRRS